MTVQAQGLDLDIWGAQAVMASVDTFYQGMLALYLHVKPSPCWHEGDLDVGYRFVNKSDETFQVLTRGDLRYKDLHHFLDRSVQHSLHPKIKGYAPRGNQRDDRAANSAGPKKMGLPDNRTATPGGPSRGPPFQGNWNRPNSNRLLHVNQSGPFRADVCRTEVNDAAPMEGNTAPPKDMTRGVTADATTEQETAADMWDANNTWDDHYLWDKLSNHGDRSYDVRAAEVVCAKVDKLIVAPTASLPAADDCLVGPWHIPVTAESNSKTLATWAEIDTGVSHTLVSANITDELHAVVTPAEGEIHLAIEGTNMPRVGTFPLTLHTTCHQIEISAEVLPGKCRSPILIGHDILSQYPIGDLMSILCDCSDEPLATTVKPDVASPDRANNSVHHAGMLAALTGELGANVGLDPHEPCPIPEALMRIPTSGPRKVYWVQP
ncbi:hypothetical protein H4R24_005624 [Coemansia sp. RSA 988]|nr:hypothetical protein H4R24_005624 [Coemansia sp. RSA 988]